MARHAHAWSAARVVRCAGRCIPGGRHPIVVPAAPMGGDRRSGRHGTLRVRASILNTAAQLQPYPLLRVTLANRFGSRIGARDFEPAEYMGKPTVRMLTPGERADATLDILDPGRMLKASRSTCACAASNKKSHVPRMLRRRREKQTMTGSRSSGPYAVTFQCRARAHGRSD